SGGLLSVVEIVQHVSAIYIGLHHFRVSLHGTGEVVGGLLQQPVLLVHIAIQQRNVGFLRQDRFILGGEAQQFVITAKVVQVIAEIDGRIAVFGEQLDHLASDCSRLLVFAGEGEIAFAFAHHPGLVIHGAGCTRQPFARKVQLMPLDSVVCAPCDGEGHFGRQLVSALVTDFGGLMLALRYVHVSQREVRLVFVGIKFGHLFKVLLGLCIVLIVACEIAKRHQCKLVVGLKREHLFESLLGFLVLVCPPENGRIAEQNVGIVRRERNRFLIVGF